MGTSPPLSRLLDVVADVVQGVRAGRSATDLLAAAPAEARGGAQALAFRTLRRLGAATEVRAALVPRAPPPPVDALLLTAIALLWPGGTGAADAADAGTPYPDHTLVDQAVHAARLRGGASAGFVNAVLRRFVRERTSLVEAAARTPIGAWNHPAWWIERLRRDWPQLWQPLLEAANEHPPMTLRVNARRSSAAAYVQRLAAAGRRATWLEDAAFGGHAVRLDEPCPVQMLPGFADGDVSVQDANAQRAAPLLLAGGLRRGARVLDACAAPGGKTAQLLELADVRVVALDNDAERLQRVHETLRRLRFEADVKLSDARETQRWWDGEPFDAVLLDAPCSASGIVRRHPDIRWLRRPADITALVKLQTELLDKLWPLLRPGGLFLYATCSLFRAEGEQRIDAFLQRLGTAAATLDGASPGHLSGLPDNAEPTGPRRAKALHDGFYYALLHKH